MATEVPIANEGRLAPTNLYTYTSFNKSDSLEILSYSFCSSPRGSGPFIPCHLSPLCWYLGMRCDRNRWLGLIEDDEKSLEEKSCDAAPTMSTLQRSRAYYCFLVSPDPWIFQETTEVLNHKEGIGRRKLLKLKIKLTRIGRAIGQFPRIHESRGNHHSPSAVQESQFEIEQWGVARETPIAVFVVGAAGPLDLGPVRVGNGRVHAHEMSASRVCLVMREDLEIDGTWEKR